MTKQNNNVKMVDQGGREESMGQQLVEQLLDSGWSLLGSTM
jgi:hypothetical protein